MSGDSAAVVVAAGRGRRLGAGNKALLPLAGEPLVAHSLRALRASAAIAEVLLVMDAADVARLREEWRTTPEELGADRVVGGGAQRWQSSRAGCRAATDAARILAVHDAARPLLRVEDVDAVLEAARRHGAALLAERLADTLKRADENGDVAATMPRAGMWRAQTPQAARRDWLLDAFAAWPQNADAPTDEAMLLEAAGHAPRIVPATGPNFKITAREDLAAAEALLAARRESHA